MAHGENAEKNGHCGRDYGGRTSHGYCLGWGSVGKFITHRRERAEKRRIEIKAMKEKDV